SIRSGIMHVCICGPRHDVKDLDSEIPERSIGSPRQYAKRRGPMRTIALLGVCVAFASADEVTLKGGGKFSGIVEEKGDKVIVRMEHGTVTFDRDRVDKIDRTKSSVLQEYDERLKNTNLSKLEDVEALLKWVEGRKMAEPAKELRE